MVKNYFSAVYDDKSDLYNEYLKLNYLFELVNLSIPVRTKKSSYVGQESLCS